MTQPAHLVKLFELRSAGRFSEAARDCLAMLRSNPRDADAIAFYGQLAIDMGRNTDAVVVFQKLLVLQPQSSYAHDRLSGLFQLVGDTVNAIKHARVALQVNPRLVDPHLVIASVLLEQGREEEAREILSQLRELDGNDLREKHTLAQGLLLRGEFDRAAPVIRELIATYPQDIEFYQMLSRCHKFAEDHPDTALLRSLLDASGELVGLQLDEDDRIVAYLTLFKVESDIGNHALAFSHLKRAKDIRKQQHPYNHQRSYAGNQALRSVFTAQWCSEHAAAGCDSTDPVFVLGMPRSGTTLTERLLASHGSITALGELAHVSRICEKASAKAGKNQHDWPALRHLPREVWAELGREYVRRATEGKSVARYFIDKMPGNFLYIGFIKAMLPRATIVHVARHPVANCLSLYEQNFGRRHLYSNDLIWTGQVYLEYREVMAYWRELYGDDILELSYESLVEDPVRALTPVGERLGITLSGEQLDAAAPASASSDVIRTASLWQARQPVHTRSVARWKQLEEQLQPLIDTLAPIL